MAEHSFFFDSSEGDEREYSQEELSKALQHSTHGNGISRLEYASPLRVSQMPNGDYIVQPGVMVVEGFFYWNDDVYTIPNPGYLQGQARKDLVVVRLDKAGIAKSIKAILMKGTDGSAVAPAIIRSGNIFDMCLAELSYDGSSVTVVDSRASRTLCGFIGDQYTKQYRVGDIIFSATDEDPGLYYGGVWERHSKGRVLVGIDEQDADFTTGKTGGAKSHTLTEQELASHKHIQDAHNHTQNAHNHAQDPHNHIQNVHTHSQDAHVHTVVAHTHTLNSHTHSGTTSNAGAHAHAGANSSSFLIWGTGSRANLVADGSEYQYATTTAAAGAHTHTMTTGGPSNNLTGASAPGTSPANPTIGYTTADNRAATAINKAVTAVNNSTTATNQNTGGGRPHNNLQPYLAVYIWIKTAD